MGGLEHTLLYTLRPGGKSVVVLVVVVLVVGVVLVGPVWVRESVRWGGDGVDVVSGKERRRKERPKGDIGRKRWIIRSGTIAHLRQ
ncbi:unnamed protein product [Arctogadus glacialis]